MHLNSIKISKYYMKHTSDYAVFTNKLTSQRLVFYPVAKNANSSTKLFLLKHLGLENKFYFLEDDMPRYLITKEMRNNLNNKNDLIGFLPPFTKFKKMNVDIKCCIVRDPIKRFISTYKNRILFHKDKNFFNHSIDLVIEKLENNLIENKHFLPQTYWLGNDLSYFTFIGKTNDLSDFINNINKFFGQNIRFPWIQTGGKKINVNLNSDQINKIKKIYEEDYFLLKDVNF